MPDQTNTMLKRFRRHFITTNLLFALAVLVGMCVAVLAFQYKQHIDNVYDALGARIASTDHMGLSAFDYNEGFVHIDLPTAPGEQADAGSEEEAQAGEEGLEVNGALPYKPLKPQAYNNGAGSGGEAGGPRREVSDDQFVATALYLVQEDGTIVSGHNEAFSVEDDQLKEAIVEVLASEDEQSDDGRRGYIPDLRLYYQVHPTVDDSYIFAFASDKFVRQGMFGLVVQLVPLTLLALVALGLISVLLSRWAVEPVETAWAQQQRFIADASHELKTPLTVITANNSILLSQPDATIGSQRHWIESSEAETRSMQDLINDMLYLAKSDASKHELEYGLIDFSELVTVQLLQFESVAFERGVVIESEVQPDVKLYADSARLQRLLGTLLDNACKYVDDNGQVEVTLRAGDKTCELRVRNSGPVVDAEDLVHLFDRFYRSDKARTRSTGGVGLGLSIAKSIVDDHKGTIRVASSADEGTTFTVELPLTR